MKIGDVVQLVSGSPNMTVISTTDRLCGCMWFYEGELKKSNFNMAVLKAVKTKSKK